MTFTETALLGALAGFTIFLGLPLGRVGRIGNRGRVALAFLAVGVLAFIFVDVMENAIGLVEEAVLGFKDGSEGLGRPVLLAGMLGGGFAVGLAGLALGNAGCAGGPHCPRSRAVPSMCSTRRRSPAERAHEDRVLGTGMAIAAAIGLHNFAEGLAIGVSAGAGEISLATVLIVGFALHNTTEGFGIVGPLGTVRPSWRWPLAVGLIGGGPRTAPALLDRHRTVAALRDLLRDDGKVRLLLGQGVQDICVVPRAWFVVVGQVEGVGGQLRSSPHTRPRCTRR